MKPVSLSDLKFITHSPTESSFLRLCRGIDYKCCKQQNRHAFRAVNSNLAS
ncbi:hypothetical protein Plhal304r1_c008g0033621 [Plasmopara halstedii]